MSAKYGWSTSNLRHELDIPHESKLTLIRTWRKSYVSSRSCKRGKWLDFDSSSIQLTQLWLKWRSEWFDSDSTHDLDFHCRLDSDSTHLSQSRVKFDSRLMSRAQPWLMVCAHRAKGALGTHYTLRAAVNVWKNAGKNLSFCLVSKQVSTE